MTERERLLQLIEEAEEKFPNMGDLVFKMAVEEYVADHLLENGAVFVDTNCVKRENLPLIQQAFNMPLDELAQLVDAKQSGRIAELPCKVGDTIYTKYKYSFKVESIEILKDKKVFRCGNDGTDDYTAFYEDEIGTEVFLTREEMEKALAKETAQNGLAYATPGFELLEG